MEMKVEFKDFECSYDCLKKVLVLLRKAFNRSNPWFNDLNCKHEEDYRILEDRLLKGFFTLWGLLRGEEFQVMSRFEGAWKDIKDRREYIELQSEFNISDFGLEDRFIKGGIIDKLAIVCFLFSRSDKEGRLDRIFSRVSNKIKDKMFSYQREKNVSFILVCAEAMFLLEELKLIVISEDVDKLRELLSKDDVTSRYVTV